MSTSGPPPVYPSGEDSKGEAPVLICRKLMVPRNKDLDRYTKGCWAWWWDIFPFSCTIKDFLMLVLFWDCSRVDLPWLTDIHRWAMFSINWMFVKLYLERAMEGRGGGGRGDPRKLQVCLRSLPLLTQPPQPSHQSGGNVCPWLPPVRVMLLRVVDLECREGEPFWI